MIKINIHFSIRIYRDGKKSGRKVEKQTSKSVPFVVMASQAINSLISSRGKSTIDNYRSALRSFLCYAGGDVLTEQISQQTVEGWQQWLLGHQVKLNTVSCYMRSLRSVVGHTSISQMAPTLFNSVFTGNTRTEKRSIPLTELQKLYKLTLPNDSPLILTRDLFLFSFYALGMPFVDVAFLQKKQIEGEYIVYQRHKTGQAIRVKIEPQMAKIINRYQSRSTKFVFPILTTGSMEEYQVARGKYNRQLKVLGTVAGVSHPLTSYVARHSWASMAYHANVELPVISKALGHTSSETTRTYIREIDDRRIDAANHKLLRSYFSKSSGH